jgi:hypothetical protein
MEDKRSAAMDPAGSWCWLLASHTRRVLIRVYATAKVTSRVAGKAYEPEGQPEYWLGLATERIHVGPPRCFFHTLGPHSQELVASNNRLPNPTTGKAPSFVHGPQSRDLSKVEQWIATLTYPDNPCLASPGNSLASGPQNGPDHPRSTTGDKLVSPIEGLERRVAVMKQSIGAS